MHNNESWMHCDGAGQEAISPWRPSRRAIVGTGLAAALSAWLGPSALAQAHTDSAERGAPILVTLFLRGGMDGLSMIVPYGDDDYHRARPTIGLGTPGAGGGKVHRLDDFYGLHPALGPLAPLFADGTMAGVQAIGSMDQSRSHFEAMATMERGAASDPAAISSGWVARFLDQLPEEKPSPLRAVAFGGLMPDILRGATNASAISSLDDLRLALPGDSTPKLPASLAALYAHGDDAISVAGRETLAVLKTLETLNPKSYLPAGGVQYPKSALGDGLKQTALLVKANVGLRTACLDRGGWDTHVTQGGAIGYLALQFEDIAGALSAFAKDLGPLMNRVTVVVMTEFGRRVPENSGLGTDHGRASSWLLMGAGIAGGKIHARWPGLAPEKLEGPGDLKVTADYRDVLGEIVATRFGLAGKLPAIFPGAPGKSLGVTTGKPSAAVRVG